MHDLPMGRGSVGFPGFFMFSSCAFPLVLKGHDVLKNSMMLGTLKVFCAISSFGGNVTSKGYITPSRSHSELVAVGRFTRWLRSPYGFALPSLRSLGK